jgi:hypothetical protein
MEKQENLRIEEKKFWEEWREQERLTVERMDEASEKRGNEGKKPNNAEKPNI